MTLKEAKKKLTAIGMTLRKTEANEYRVNFARGSENTAYYTDNLDDAVQSAEQMNEDGSPETRAAAEKREAVQQRLQSESEWMLVDRNEAPIEKGEAVHIGSAKYIVADFRAPKHSGSTGKVILKSKDGNIQEFYPYVIGAAIIRK